MVPKITKRARQLLEILQEQYDWMSRSQLARASGKKVLSPHDKELLERLISAGLVEKRQRESNTPVGIAFDYRATSQKGKGE